MNQVDQPLHDSTVTPPASARTSPVRHTDTREVAVVHGRDLEVANAVFEFLRALDLRPREWEEILHRAASGSPYTGHLIDMLFEDVQAVVVLLTPDDEARLHPDLQQQNDPAYETRFTGQARPNVLFEAGMAFGLYPQRTILVEVGELRPASDLLGRNTVRLSGSPKAIQNFVARLRAAGCAIRSEGADWLDSSRFVNLAAFSRTAISRLEIPDRPPRLYPTNIWLNSWETGSCNEILELARSQYQIHPVTAKTLLRDLSRSANSWSLYSRKEGPNAPLRLRGQVNLQASGASDLRLLLVQQRFVLEGRPLPSPPDAGPFGFVMTPGQEINVNFEAAVPDREFQEGELLYALHAIYEDEGGTKRQLEVFWWYDFSEDKFWNNLNKVPYIDAVRKSLW